MSQILAQIRSAADEIRAGRIVAFPTETFYGLAVDPGDVRGVERLLDLKGRALHSGMPLILSEAVELEKWIAPPRAEVRAAWNKLVQHFWPGPLTLVVAANDAAQGYYREGIYGPDKTLAFRVSPHEIAQQLAAKLRGVITATSANPRGEPPPKTAAEVRRYFPEMFVIEGAGSGAAAGPTELPSTLLDVRVLPFRVLRQGAVSREELLKFVELA